MKYSILVCAYNAEKFLKECLDSLINQTIDKSKYEIILVNDGSKDNTQKIAQKYKDINIINQKNLGLPEARNTALKNAQGDWIIFVDADDYISLDYLQTIDNINHTDINFIIMNEIKEKKAAKKDKKIQSNKMDDAIISRIIHKDLLKTYLFPGKYKYAIEDWDFYVHNIKNIKALNATSTEAYYFYRFNKDSLSKSHKVYRSRLEHAITIFENKELRTNNLEENIIGHYYEHLYMMAKLWFPDLLPRVKLIKYKTKIKFSIKLQYWIVKIGIFNWAIRKTMQKIDQ